MIRIRKQSKTTRRKLTGVIKEAKEAGNPGNPKVAVIEKAEQKNPKAAVIEKAEPKNPRVVASEKAEPKRVESRDQGKKRRIPSYSKKGQRGRQESRPDARAPEKAKKVEIPLEKLEKGAFVLPGELVGTTEEYRAGKGTTVVVGDIYSSVTGHIVIDPHVRVVSVLPVTTTPNILKEGDIVFGRVTDVRESGALVEIAAIEGKTDREVMTMGLADLHVSHVRDSYVKRLANEFQASDIIRAKVLSLDRTQLSTTEASLGVMKAYCSNCRGALVLEGTKLKCPVCNRTETRKVSSEYGKGIN